MFSAWIGDFEVYDSGNNRIAMMVFDPLGIRYLLFNRHGVAGTDEAPGIALVGTAF